MRDLRDERSASKKLGSVPDVVEAIEESAPRVASVVGEKAYAGWMNTSAIPVVVAAVVPENPIRPDSGAVVRDEKQLPRLQLPRLQRQLGGTGLKKASFTDDGIRRQLPDAREIFATDAGVILVVSCDLGPHPWSGCSILLNVTCASSPRRATSIGSSQSRRSRAILLEGREGLARVKRLRHRALHRLVEQRRRWHTPSPLAP
jgi:hypothetical protein